MIQIYSSNSYALLRRLLIEMVRAERSAGGEELASVFGATSIVVPGEAVRDDLMRSFARVEGIASGLEMQFLGQWLEPRTGAVVGKSNRGYELEWMVWTLLKEPTFIGRPECARLRHYLHEQSEAAYVQLARRIANLFTIYVSYRVDWVLDWMREDDSEDTVMLHGDDERHRRENKVLLQHPDALWQKLMWREIAKGEWGPEQLSWSGVRDIEDIPNKFAAARSSDGGRGGRAVHLFVPSVMPPLALPFLWAEAAHSDVTIYLMNPSCGFWFEGLAPHTEDGTRGLDFHSENMGSASGFEWFRKNASRTRALIERLWTFAGQPEVPQQSVIEDDFVRNDEQNDPRGRMLRLEDLRVPDAQEADSFFVDPTVGPRPTVLQRLQKAVLEDDASRLQGEIDKEDESLLIVKCPTSAREAEAVFDWIDALIEKSRDTDDPIKAEDILIVTPDIDAAAPLIGAALTARGDRHVAVRIAGRTELEEDDFAQAVLAVGRFLFSKAEKAAFEELLSFDAVLRKWGSRDVDVEHLSQWLTAGGYRWGIDAEHARFCVDRGLALDEEGGYEGTLDRALERLVLGFYARTQLKDPLGDVLPMTGVEVEGFESSAVTEHSTGLDGLVGFARALQLVRHSAPADATAAITQWCDWTRGWMHELFDETRVEKAMRRFEQQLTTLVQTAGWVLQSRPVAFEVFWDAVGALVKDSKTMTRATGAVTVAGMDAFRWIPFRAVAMIGLNAGQAFPGQNRSEEFDLMQAQGVIDGRSANVRRKGDGDSRAGNRNVFLDLLLAARDHVMISYCTGLKNVEEVPSIVVQELKRVLTTAFGDSANQLIVKLPASGYSPDNFSAKLGMLASRNKTALEAYCEGVPEDFLAPRPDFADTGLVAKREHGHRVITTAALASMINSPDRWLEKQAGIDSLGNNASAEVPLVIPENKLIQWKISDRCARDVLAGLDADDIVARAALDPTLCASALRSRSIQGYADKAQRCRELAEELASHMGAEEEIPAQTLIFDGAGKDFFDAIRAPKMGLRAPLKEGKLPASVHIVSGSSHKNRLFMQLLVRCALGEQLEMWLIDWEDNVGPSGAPKFERWTTASGAENAPALSRRLLEAWLDVVNAQCAHAPAYWAEYSAFGKDATKPAPSLMLAAGDTKRRLTQTGNALKQCFMALTGLFVTEPEEWQMPLFSDGTNPRKPKGGRKKGGATKDPVQNFEESYAKWRAVYSGLISNNGGPA